MEKFELTAIAASMLCTKFGEAFAASDAKGKATAAANTKVGKLSQYLLDESQRYGCINAESTARFVQTVKDVILADNVIKVAAGEAGIISYYKTGTQELSAAFSQVWNRAIGACYASGEKHFQRTEAEQLKFDNKAKASSKNVAKAAEARFTGRDVTIIRAELVAKLGDENFLWNVLKLSEAITAGATTMRIAAHSVDVPAEKPVVEKPVVEKPAPKAKGKVAGKIEPTPAPTVAPDQLMAMFQQFLAAQKAA